MKHLERERRAQQRAFTDPNDTGNFLQFVSKDIKYRFNLLDKSQGGIGMLVSNEEADVLAELRIGSKLEMEHWTPKEILKMNFEISHITPIRKGAFKGDHQVGLSLIHDST